MKKVVLRAEYKTENTFNEGYICIETKDNREKIIEGVFGLDYVKIDFSNSNTFDLVLVESIYTVQNHILVFTTKTTIFTSQYLSDNELFCPEQYLLSSVNDEFLSLSLIQKETSIPKINEVYQYLVQLRP